MHSSCLPWVLHYTATFDTSQSRSKAETDDMLLLMQLVSSDYEPQARQKFAWQSGGQQAGKWKWVASPFSTSVHYLAPSQAVAAQLGQGGSSLGYVT